MGLQRHSLRHEIEEEENSHKSIVLEDVEVDNNKKSLKSHLMKLTLEMFSKREIHKRKALIPIVDVTMLVRITRTTDA